MYRVLRAPRDPEAVTLAALALREYAGGGSGRTQFEADFIQGFQDFGLSTAAAARLVDNFDSVRPSVREGFLGPQGRSDARPPAGVAPRRDPATVTTHGIELPGLLRARSPLLGGAPLRTTADQPLAPNEYGIQYQGMHCVDETWWDWRGSDKPYIITSAVHINRVGENVVRTEGHPFSGGRGGEDWYTGVDSGDTRQGPVARCWLEPVADVAEGVSLTTIFFEHDSGDPNEYREEVDQLVKLALFLAGIWIPGLGPIFGFIATQDWLTDFFNWFLSTGDNPIGDAHTTVLTMPDLEDFGRSHPSNSYSRGNIKFNLPYHFVASVNDNDYFAAFTVSRDPKEFYPEPIVE